jgi:hypothetical protein
LFDPPMHGASRESGGSVFGTIGDAVQGKWGQSQFNCGRSGFRLGGRPLGSGATRRLSGLTIESLHHAMLYCDNASSAAR